MNCSFNEKKGINKSLIMVLSILFIMIGLSVSNIEVKASDDDFVIEDGVLVEYIGSDENVVVPDDVTSIGAGAFDECDFIKSIELPDSLISINDYAFAYCEKLEDIELTDNITYIGAGAFEYCYSITNIKIPNSVTEIFEYTFLYCTSLTDIEISNNVTNIERFAFSGCESLESIDIPNNVISIEGSAFGDCSSLTEINVAENNTEYCSNGGILFSKDMTAIYCYPQGRNETYYEIPDNVIYIGDYAFNSSKLKNIIFPNGLTSIGSFSFSDCENITAISIPNSVDEVSMGAFSGCINLETITLSDNISYIDSNVFSDCSSLKNIVIPNKVNTIAWGAFSDCSSLENVIIPNSVNNIESYAFYGCISLNTMTLPNSITSIGGYAFGECTNLSNIIIPPKVTSIGDDAFSGCSNLSELVISKGVITIGDSAFINCSSLNNVIIPESVISIGSYAFSSCYNLKNITIPRSVLNIEDGVFEDIGDTITIKCFENSYAHNYAVNNYITFSLLQEIPPTIPPTTLPIGTQAVTSTEKPTEILISSILLVDKTMFANKKYTITPIISPSNATNKSLTYKSTNSRCATVNSKGIVKAKRSGQTRIIVSSNDGSRTYAECTITIKPAAPKNFKVKKWLSTSIKISWKKDRYVTGYEVYRSTKRNGGYKKIKPKIMLDRLGYVNWSLKPNKQYYYKVRAYDIIGDKKIRGKYTSIKSARL
jgi:hypothetical protein